MRRKRLLPFAPAKSPDRHKAELYNVQKDFDELHNLIDDPRQLGRIAEMRNEMTRLMQELGMTRDVMPIDEGIKQELPDQKIR